MNWHIIYVKIKKIEGRGREQKEKGKLYWDTSYLAVAKNYVKNPMKRKLSKIML
jgi:hypothetical protein